MSDDINNEEYICEFSQFLDDNDIRHFLKHLTDNFTNFKKTLWIILSVCKYLIITCIVLMLIVDLFLLYTGSKDSFKDDSIIILISVIVVCLIKYIKEIEVMMSKMFLKIIFMVKHQRTITLFNTYILIQRKDLKLKILFDDIKGIYKTKVLLFINTNNKYVLVSLKQPSIPLETMLNYLEETLPDKFHKVNSNEFKLKRASKTISNLI